jgi:hypothetical protein
MKGTEHFVSLSTSVVLTKQYNVVVNSKGLISTPGTSDTTGEVLHTLSLETGWTVYIKFIASVICHTLA